MAWGPIDVTHILGKCGNFVLTPESAVPTSESSFPKETDQVLAPNAQQTSDAVGLTPGPDCHLQVPAPPTEHAG